VNELLVRVDLVALPNFLFGQLEGFNLRRRCRETLIESAPLEFLLFAECAASLLVLLDLGWIDNFDKEKQVWADEDFLSSLDL
jgi:hypothetical protein